MKNVTILEELILDFKNELNVVNFDNNRAKDDSYEFMIMNLQTRFEEKEKDDKSISLLDCKDIIDILNNEELPLNTAYHKVLNFLYELEK